MPARKTATAAEPDETLTAAIAAAAAAGERFVEAKSELEHRLADIDGALVDLVQRVYDSTPGEYQRVFRVSENGGAADDLALPDFVRYLIERPRGTTGTFTIQVTENLYDTGDGDDDPDEDDELNF
ncbi:MAG TPA: hypothetical protein VFJ82_00750 [Longimicrobium sp.]|nr:hypothetical protein [Longimicrobium sp.]